MKSKNELSEAARQARNAYNRRWYAANRERVRARQREFWEKKARENAKGDDEKAS